jgi:hypothetical protein
MPGSPDLMEGMRGLDESGPLYEERWRYFAGDLPERFASDRLKQMISRTGRDYRLRLARVPVVALSNRLGINAITSSLGDAVNARIEEIRQANDMEVQEPFLTERLLALGDVYLFVWPVFPEDLLDDESPADIEAIATGVKLAYQSPTNCRAFYDSEDGRNVRFVVRRWEEASPLGKTIRAEVWYADRLEAWITQPGATGTDPESWLPYAEDVFGVPVPADGDNWPEPHDFGEIPIKHGRTSMPYGDGEADDFIGAQNLITKATATLSSGIEAHGWRERYRIAEDKEILNQAGDIVPWGDAADAASATVNGRTQTPVSGRSQGPGTEQVYHGTKAVGEFAPPDIGAFIEPMDSWVRLGAAASSTPLTAFDPRFGANMSGVAWDRAERPLRAKEKTRKLYLLRFWREVYGLALLVVGIADAGDIDIEWSPAEVINDPEWWATATIRRDHGVPEKQILIEANYTPEEIETWEKEQKDALLLTQRIEQLSLLGDALQKLGAGASLLGVPPERVAKLVEDILGDAGSPGRLVLEEKEPLDLTGGNGDDTTDSDPAGGNGNGDASGNGGGAGSGGVPNPGGSNGGPRSGR